MALGEGPYDTKDKFRVDIFYDKRLIGRKLIPCTLTKEIETEVCSVYSFVLCREVLPYLGVSIHCRMIFN